MCFQYEKYISNISISNVENKFTPLLSTFVWEVGLWVSNYLNPASTTQYADKWLFKNGGIEAMHHAVEEIWLPALPSENK